MAKKLTRAKHATKPKSVRRKPATPKNGANADNGGNAAAERAVIVTGKTGNINTGTQIVIKGSDAASRALRIYLDALRNACTQLPIAAMGGREETRKDVTLDQVYIALDTTQPAPEPKRKASLAHSTAHQRGLRPVASRGRLRTRGPLPQCATRRTRLFPSPVRSATRRSSRTPWPRPRADRSTRHSRRRRLGSSRSRG